MNIELKNKADQASIKTDFRNENDHSEKTQQQALEEWNLEKRKSNKKTARGDPKQRNQGRLECTKEHC